MKTLITVTALALAAATGASAMTASNVDIQTIESFAPGVDASGLSDAEVLTVLNAIHSEDGNGTRAWVKNFVEKNG